METPSAVVESGHAGLLEREAEVRQLRAAIANARDGAGGMALIDGPAGIGKTSLLWAARDFARACGMLVLSARGRRLERAFTFGVARQLLEPTLAELDADARARMLSGAAGMAAPVLHATDVVHPRDPGASFRTVHGLFWLTANLAERRPILLLVDDLQWADDPSLQFLDYLAARCAELPVLAVLAVRTGEPTRAPELVATLRAEPDALCLAPTSLGESAVHRIVSAALGQAAAPEFCAACMRLTAGNPFLLSEVIAVLRDQGLKPTAENARRVERVRPANVARAVAGRLARLGPDALALAQAVALLDGSGLRDAATLAQLSPDAARAAADQLYSAQILRPGSPVIFEHPLLRTAVYGAIPPAARSHLHRLAVLVLLARGEPPAAVAPHLLRSEPTGAPEIARVCRQAAQAAIDGGDPATAIQLLTRCLAEPPADADRAEILAALGEAELLERRPSAGTHLRQALALAPPPGLRVRLVSLLAEWLLWHGRVDDVHALVDETFAALGNDPTPALAAALETLRTGLGSLSARLSAAVDARLPGMHALARRAGPSGRSLLIAEGCWRGQRGLYDGAADWRELIDEGLDHGRFVAEHAGASLMVDLAAAVLILCDEVARASTLLADMRAYATAHGSIRVHLNAVSWDALLALRCGRIPHALEEARTALALAREHRVIWTEIWASAVLAEALVERCQFEEAETVMAGAPIELPPESPASLHALMARARLRLAQNRPGEAVDDLRQAGRYTVFDNPNFIPWRGTLAYALGYGHPEAPGLVAEELRRARQLGQPRGIAFALRTRASVAPSIDRVASLTEAVSLLRDGPDSLALGRALWDLGAVRRRIGRRAAAREPLREAIELAYASGSELLATRAQEELLATGAHPRRQRFAGPEALTPSERRVAVLAGRGLTNREIAQSLFVTTKTVGTHLGHIYRKLGLQGPSAREALTTLVPELEPAGVTHGGTSDAPHAPDTPHRPDAPDATVALGE